MKRLRHRLGRWLLRDAPKPETEIRVVVEADQIVRAIRRGLPPGSPA